MIRLMGVVAALMLFAACAGPFVAQTAVPTPLLAASPAPSFASTSSPVLASTPTPSATPAVDPAADYRIAAPHTFSAEDDPAHEAAQFADLETRIGMALGIPPESVQIGFRTIDPQGFPANFWVIRLPSGVISGPGVVDEILAIAAYNNPLHTSVGAFRVGGLAVTVHRNDCFGETDPGSICFVAAYVNGDDLAWISSDSTRPLRKARALMTAIISATTTRSP